MRKGNTRERRSRRWRWGRKWALWNLPKTVRNSLTDVKLEKDRFVLVLKAKFPMTYLKLNMTI